MAAYIAKHHINIAGRLYAPGDGIEERLGAEQEERLTALGAIEKCAVPEDETVDAPEDETVDAPEEMMEPPEMDVSAGIVPEARKPKAGKGGRKA